MRLDKQAKKKSLLVFNYITASAQEKVQSTEQECPLVKESSTIIYAQILSKYFYPNNDILKLINQP